MSRDMTDKQKMFVAEYLVDLNATQAAVRAGYSAKNAARIAVELLNKTHVAEAIQRAKTHREKRTMVTQDSVVAELAKIAFGDARDVMRWGPNGVVLLDSENLTDEQVASIAEVSETTTKDGGSVKLKRHDKVKALELLGRHLGLFVERKGDGTEDAEIKSIRVIIEDGRKSASNDKTKQAAV